MLGGTKRLVASIGFDQARCICAVAAQAGSSPHKCCLVPVVGGLVRLLRRSLTICTSLLLLLLLHEVLLQLPGALANGHVVRQQAEGWL